MLCFLVASLSPAWALAPYLKYPDDTDYLLIQENTLQAKCGAYTLSEPLIRTITAYNSEPNQTDSTPFITASGTKVREGIVASNEFPFGTRLLIDGQVYVVEDRTNSRYSYLIDIWFAEKEEAIKFGRQIKKIYLLD